MYFEKKGEENTQKTLEIAKEVAKERGIPYIVVASTTGKTALLAAKLLKDTGIKLVVVTHNTGFKEDKQEFSSSIKKQVEELGGVVYTGTMVLRGIGRAIRDKMQRSDEQLVATTLRMLGEGIKVCCEIVAMACDAGLIPLVDVIAVAGTARGADTAVIIGANPSNRFFDIKIREILAKPRDF